MEGNTLLGTAVYRTEQQRDRQRFEAIEGSSLSKASAKVREEMTSDKKLFNLVNQLDSSYKT